MPSPEGALSGRYNVPGAPLSVVAVIWITCPTTGRRFPTGLETDLEGPAIPARATEYKCAACGTIHLWADVKAELVPEPPSIIG